MKFKLRKIPYDDNQVVFKKSEVDIKPGLTVLVGCNGSGKTTLLHYIKSTLKEQNIACHSYNNYVDGGHKAISSMLYYGNISDMCSLATSSEGENIILNLGRQSIKYREFLKTGFFQDEEYEMDKAFGIEEVRNGNQRFLLFDAIDSGLSINMVMQIKELFELMFADAEKMGIELYIVVSANEYELCNGEPCFDVTNGKYITFNDYEDYKKFILDSAAYKEKRLASKSNKKTSRPRNISKTRNALSRFASKTPLSKANN